MKGAKEHVEASRRLVALTERETAETQAHIAESKRLMAESHKLLKRPRDPIALAKLIGDIATGQVEDKVEDKRDPAAVAMGQKGGKGAGKMTPERRAEIARKAAAKRWGKTD